MFWLSSKASSSSAICAETSAVALTSPRPRPLTTAWWVRASTSRTEGVARQALLKGHGQDRVDRTEVGLHLVDLHGDPGEEFDLALERRLRGRGGRHEVVDLRVLALAVAVDAAGSLLELVGVEGDVVVDQPVAVVLEVDALPAASVASRMRSWCSAGSAWKPGGSAPGRRCPCRRRGVRSGRRRSPGSQELFEPVEGVAVFGEDHDALVRPMAAGFAGLGEEGEEAGGLRVRLGSVFDGPVADRGEGFAFGRVQALLVARGATQGLVLVVEELVVVEDGGFVVVLVEVLGHVVAERGRLGRERPGIGGVRVREGPGAGEQALLEQERHEVCGGPAAAALDGAGPAGGREVAEAAVDLELVLGVVKPQVSDLAGGELRVAFRVDDARLEAADHHFVLGRRRRRDAAGEAGRVEDF